MPYTTVIDTATLAAHLDDPDWAIIDCRFELADTGRGEAAYRAGHIPGAVYAHLDRDLSSAPVTDRGRHPLPSPAAMTRLFGRLGIGERTQVVAYDDSSGHYAARLWWMLRYLGHQAVAVLDGGWGAWAAEGRPTQPGIETRDPALFMGEPRADRLVTIDAVESRPLLVDSRAPERYRGEVEPLDPVAGHIPGAINRPYDANWSADGRWRPPEELAGAFGTLLGGTAAAESTFYCGSGVSACVNLLAMVHAGLPEGRLYVGSWSEWSRVKVLGDD
jgi:thiosulfate/3-mercaptopyruvate sulfurtransferase